MVLILEENVQKVCFRLTLYFSALSIYNKRLEDPKIRKA